jgi:hypothetical protein
VTVTSRSFDPTLGLTAGGLHWIGDYQALATGPGTFHAVWNDTRTGQMELFTAAVGNRR